MSFIGMGPLEVFLVLLVAFLVMGPQRMIEIAKLFGKALSELRRLNSGLAEVLEDSAEVDTVSSESDKDNKEQAEERAFVNRKNKGGEAARVCLKMFELKNNFGLSVR